MKWEKIREILINLINISIKIIFGTIILGLTISSIFFTSVLEKRETTKFIMDNWILNIFSIIALISIIIFLKIKKIKIKNTKKIIIILTIVWIIIAIIWIFSTRLLPRADQKDVLNAVNNILKNDFSDFDRGGYISMCTNQIGLVLIELVIAKLSFENTNIVFQILNAIFLISSFYIISKITLKLFKNKKIAIYTYICLMLFIPIFFYITFVYGNIIGFFLSMLSIWFELKFLEYKKYRYAFLSGIFIALAIMAKNNYLVTLIAMCLIIIINVLENKKIIYLIVVIIYTSLFICVNILFTRTIETITGRQLNDGIPAITYIAMGMQEGKYAPGWFNDYNFKIYRENLDIEKIKEISKQDILKRIQEFKEDKKYFLEFYSKKILSQWNNPTFQSFWVNKRRKSDIQRPWYVKSILGKGKVNKVLTKYMDIYQTIILFGVTVYLIRDYKKIKGNKLIFILVFIGGFLFHIIWEAKCQYTITYFILLIPYSVKGYDLITKKIYINFRKKESD